MMLSFFKWISTLSIYEGISYFILLLIILLVIPYTSIISTFFKFLIYKHELKILFFGYSITPEVLVGKDDLGREIYVDTSETDILIAGTKITFVWQVEGAYRVDLIPLKKNVSGNSANSIIDPSELVFILEAYGFFGNKLTSTIQIPVEKIYHLDISQISSYHHLIRNTPILKHSKFTSAKFQNLAISKTKYGRNFDWTRFNLFSIFSKAKYSENVIVPGINKKKLYKAIDDAKHLKGYNFSTTKYNALLTSNIVEKPNKEYI